MSKDGVGIEKVGVEFDPEAQKNLDYQLGTRELYPYPAMWMAESLKEHGVTMAFGVYGGHIFQMVDAISRIGIKNVVFLHEQNAVYCGEAYAQVSGRPAVCYATVGPGVANCVSPMQQAYLSNTPMIFLAGGHEIEHDKLYNTIQESYATELMGDITKWSQRIIYPNMIKQFMTRAWKEAQDAPKGPVVMEIGLSCLLSRHDVKNHVWFGAYGDHASWIPDWRGEDTPKAMACGGDPALIEKAVKRLYEIDKPFMILGDGAMWADASEELTELVTLAQIPFTTRRTARAVISEKHPYHYRGLPPFRKEIDILIPVGLKVGFFDGYGAGWPETIQINETAKQIWTYLPTSTAIVGSPKVVARQMIDYIKANNLQLPAGRDAWIKKVQQAAVDTREKRRAKAMKYADHPKYQQENCMHWGYVSQAIGDYLEEKYESKVRVVVDGFTISDYCMPYLTAVRPAQILSSSEQAGVGHGIGMAIGAAFAQMEMGDRTPVLSLMGDAGMGNAMMEIDTAARYNLPIVYLVTENNGWMGGMKYPWYGKSWQALGAQDRAGAEWMGKKQGAGGLTGEREPRLRFDNLARELNCYGDYVDRHSEFKAALERCFKAAEHGQPAVLHCRMDTHQSNSNMTGPVYCMCMAHLPWDEIPKAGKAARRTYLGHPGLFDGLAEFPEMPLHNPWDPYTDEETEI